MQWIGLNKTQAQADYEYIPDRSTDSEEANSPHKKQSEQSKQYLNEKSSIVLTQTEAGELTSFPSLLDEFKTEFMISGVSPLGNDFIFLAYIHDEVRVFANLTFWFQFTSLARISSINCHHPNCILLHVMENLLASIHWEFPITRISNRLIIRVLSLRYGAHTEIM